MRISMGLLYHFQSLVLSVMPGGYLHGFNRHPKMPREERADALVCKTTLRLLFDDYSKREITSFVECLFARACGYPHSHAHYFARTHFFLYSPSNSACAMMCPAIACSTSAFEEPSGSPSITSSA